MLKNEKMKKRFLLFIIFIIFIVSLTTLVLVLNYVDPYEYKVLAISSLLFSYTLTISCFFTILFYFIKKIYYRGNVYIYQVLSSFRQGFLVAIFTSSLVYFYNHQVPVWLWWGILFLILFLLEIFVENYEN